jgi:hypothetical protein
MSEAARRLRQKKPSAAYSLSRSVAISGYSGGAAIGPRLSEQTMP